MEKDGIVWENQEIKRLYLLKLAIIQGIHKNVKQLGFGSAFKSLELKDYTIFLRQKFVCFFLPVPLAVTVQYSLYELCEWFPHYALGYTFELVYLVVLKLISSLISADGFLLVGSKHVVQTGYPLASPRSTIRPGVCWLVPCGIIGGVVTC